jgi:hypothetical protein
MSDSHKRFQEIFDELFTLSLSKKGDFLEALLFSFTIAGRSIWSNEQTSDLEKAEAFKWLNELNHRIWNIRYELKQGIDSDSIKRLYENLKFYSEQSAELLRNLVPTVLSAFDNFQKKY